MAKFFNDQGEPLTYEELENRLEEEISRFDRVSLEKMNEGIEQLRNLFNAEGERDSFRDKSANKLIFLRDLIGGGYTTIAQVRTAIQNFLNNNED